jgi:redox-sensitive bicupin YhaK (pirin superfamily)
MHVLRPAAARGHADHGWLDTWHSFSFADYHDPAWMGFRNLRVLNEDVVAPGTGFGMHPHREMEIVTWVLSGALRHKDSLGHEAVIRPGEAQRMSAGTGILHSEANPSDTEPVHLLQIWILPATRGGTPGYEQRVLPTESTGLRLLAAPAGEGGTVTIQADARIWVLDAPAHSDRQLELAEGRHAWLQVCRGRLSVNGVELKAGDGLGLSLTPRLNLRATEDCQALLFDLG